MSSPNNTPDPEDYAARDRQNLIVFAVIVVLIAIGIWLVFGASDYAKLEECLEAGHRNCQTQ